MLRKYGRASPPGAPKVPTGLDWFHEIKHDGYRLIVQREGNRVRLLTGRGYDWSDRYPLIVEAAQDIVRHRSGSRCAQARPDLRF
jgi:ATP-dependent DNA ligase